MRSLKRIPWDPWDKLKEIEKSLGAAQNLVSGLENQARVIQHILVISFSPQSAGYLKSAVHNYLPASSCQLVADVITWGIKKQIELFAVLLKEREYPERICVDNLIERLDESSLQVEMLYGRIGRVKNLLSAVEKKFGEFEALEA